MKYDKFDVSWQMYFSLRFSVWLKWIDTRLQYQNLDVDAYENVIPEEVAAKLWLPTLYFQNSNEGQILNYDSSSQIMAVRSGSSKKAPFSQLNEGKVYNASETQLKWMSVQLRKFKCTFDLYYLPFDNQTCKVKVRIFTKNCNLRTMINFHTDFKSYIATNNIDRRSIIKTYR